MSDPEKYMSRCIELAQNGLGTTYPNPLVGSVIVHQNRIIGEGWHRKAGGPHAEVHAVDSVKDKSLLPEATIYVSLEPCSHFGKTPPCSDLILDCKIPEVVIGTSDPNPLVAGKGIAKLKAAGRKVTVGVLQQQCLELNHRFFTFHLKKRPYVILKWAQSADGFLAPEHKETTAPFWLSNTYSRQLVHKWRTEEQAILVGTKTVLDDDPTLDARDWKGISPIRIVLDREGKINPEAKIFKGNSRTIVITEKEKNEINNHLIFENTIFDTLLAERVLTILYQHQIQSVIIEGGRQTLQTFIDAGLWDRAEVFCSKTQLGNGLKAPLIQQPYKKLQIAGDELLTFFNYDQSDNI